MECSLAGTSVHGILQARILEWVAISFSRGCSWPRDRTHIFCISCIGRQAGSLPLVMPDSLWGQRLFPLSGDSSWNSRSCLLWWVLSWPGEQSLSNLSNLSNLRNLYRFLEPPPSHCTLFSSELQLLLFPQVSQLHLLTLGRGLGSTWVSAFCAAESGNVEQEVVSSHLPSLSGCPSRVDWCSVS